jgi:hypothetical protein
MDYLLHRAQDRLSVAVVAGEEDPVRREAVEALAPYLTEIGVRTRAWTVARLGRELPPPETLAEVYRWLNEDVKRRRDEAKARPGLAVSGKEAPAEARRADRMVETAEAELEAGRLWRGAALLEGVSTRHAATSAANRAEVLLKELKDDPRKRKALAAERGAEERRVRSAEARRLERTGDLAGALRAWEAMGDDDEVKRLTPLAARAPYLGLRLEGDSIVVGAVRPDGPAARAGVRAGDRLRTLGGVRVASAADVVGATAKLHAGERVAVEVERDGKTVELNLEVGSPPAK